MIKYSEKYKLTFQVECYQRKVCVCLAWCNFFGQNDKMYIFGMPHTFSN